MNASLLLVRLADALEVLEDFEGADMAESMSRTEAINVEIPIEIAKLLLEHPDRAIAVVLPMIESALDKRAEESDMSS